MVKLKQQLVSNVQAKKVTYNGKNAKSYITIHETANTSKGANAQTHANLQQNGFSASWHYTVDDTQAIQSFPNNAQCWHAGTTNGNKNSIGIEICVNSDGDFKKAIKNAAELVKKLMKDENISIDRVVQHNFWSGKNCPTNLRNGSKGINWSEFKGLLSGKAQVSTSKPASKPTSKPATSSGSIVDYLNAKGINSSFANRKKLAAKHGISNYKGTAAQNNTLLSKLKGGSKPTSKPTKKKVTGKTADIQRKLNEYKVNNIPVDNLKGPKTYKALRKAYQYELNRQFNAGLVVDGLAGPKTDNAAVTLYENKTYGNLAYLTQAMLYFKGYSISVDGYWQSKSVTVTKSYQKDVKLNPDGKPGKATYKKLIRF